MGGHNRETPCHGKDRYAAFDHATRIAARHSARKGITLSVYRCRACGWFHLTKRRQMPA